MEPFLITPDNERLEKAKELAEKKEDKPLTIGIMKEHTLHRVMKFYLSIDESDQEILINKRFADVVIHDQIYEIQTKSFNLLRGKLDNFLKDHDVTIVYPVAVNKTNYLFSSMGELLSKKKSPKHATPFEIGPELYKIKPYLTNPHLSFLIFLFDIKELRVEAEKVHYHSKGYERENQIPEKIIKIYSSLVDALKDYITKEPFNAKEFAKMTHLSSGKSCSTLNALFSMGLVERVDKIKNAYIYQIKKGEKNERGRKSTRSRSHR